MKIENTVKIMKEVHPDRIIMVKAGNFYHCYGKDAVLLSYLFNYVIKKNDANVTCGFPVATINKVIAEIENKKISYLTVNKADAYSVEEEQDYKNKNKYIDLYDKARKYTNKKNRIEGIYNYFIQNIDDDDIKNKIIKVEEIIYEI